MLYNIKDYTSAILAEHSNKYHSLREATNITVFGQPLNEKRQTLMSLPLSYHDCNKNLLTLLLQPFREPRLH